MTAARMSPGVTRIQVYNRDHNVFCCFIYLHIYRTAMYPDPDFAQSEIHNDRFVLMDGVVGLTFDERKGVVYFQPLATDRWV